MLYAAKYQRSFQGFIKLPAAVFSLLVIIFFFCQPGASTAQSQDIRVGLTLQGGQVELSFCDGYELVNRSDGASLQLTPGRYRIINAGGGIEVLDMLGSSRGVFSGPLYLQPLSSPASSLSFRLHNAANGSEYRGALKIVRDGGGLTAVNIIDIESYLCGVVPREMPSSWGNYEGGMEALKAQAVAARTYALYNCSRQRHDHYHVCDTQHCQVYGGKACETANINAAVEETRGEVLTYQGSIIEAYYHATNGGYTEAAQHVWASSRPYFSSEYDPYDDPADPSNIAHNNALWQAEIPLDAVSYQLASRGYSAPDPVSQVQVVSTYPSGRVEELRILGARGQELSLFREAARSVLGLRSQLFTVREETEKRYWVASSSGGIQKKERYTELEGKWVVSADTIKSMLIGSRFTVLGKGVRGTVPYESIVIEGRGWGHGVGMSQYGAYNRARDGHDYSKILSFYYPGTQLGSGY